MFDGFPGLTLRSGRETRVGVPVCGCDACDETLPDCREVLGSHVDAVVAGTFGERLVLDRGWWHETWSRSRGTGSRGRVAVDDEQLPALRAALGEVERS